MILTCHLGANFAGEIYNLSYPYKVCWHVHSNNLLCTLYSSNKPKNCFYGTGLASEGHQELKGSEVGEFFRAHFSGLLNRSIKACLSKKEAS